jgi:hypothetical protein
MAAEAHAERLHKAMQKASTRVWALRYEFLLTI